MIKRLFIKDFAIIRELEIPLKPGLTVITGETGAGKSVLVKGLAVALGAKAVKTDVRSGTERAIVETEAQINETSVTVRRLISKGGRTRSFFDDEPVAESKYQSQVNSIADFHGQHEQQYIMDPGTHIDFLDNYCGLKKEVQIIQTCFQELTHAQESLIHLKSKKKESENRRDLITFQLQEIDGVNPGSGEDVSLRKEFKTLTHMDELIDTVSGLNQTLTEQDHSVYQQLASAINKIEMISEFDEAIKPFVESLKVASVSIQDVSSGLMQHVDALDHDTSKLQEIEDRYLAIEGLKRKYGGTIESALDYARTIREELDSLGNIDGDIQSLESSIVKTVRQYQKLADRLNKQRKSKATDLENAIVNKMASLNMPGAAFRVGISTQKSQDSKVTYEGKPVQIGPKGYNKIAFFLSANPGEEPKPLQRVASGGEVSRIMLAIKSILKENDPVNTLIFDEIDAGISGQAAEKVAENLWDLANDKQVICITHLPQIASRADHHIYIKKNQQAQSTTVNVSYLSAEEKVQAIAELFSGLAVTGESISTARRFLDQAHG